jgi:CHAD domain-containing protein
LAKVADVPSALQAMIGVCLLHLQANVPGAVQRLDEEYLHQVRVALRRLRVVLSMARIFHADAELSYLNEQVTELCVEFGRLREWDVFVTQILMPLRSHLSEQDRIRLFKASEERRVQHHAVLESRLQSQDYQRFLLRFGAWMHGDYWRVPVANDLSLLNFATHILDNRNRQLDKRAKHLATANPEQLHILRIACKKLRYSAEIFATLFDPVKAKNYLSKLSVLQDTLGLLNDIEVSHRLLNDLDAGTQHKSTLLIRGFIERDYQDQIIKLNREWKLFARQRAFWLD